MEGLTLLVCLLAIGAVIWIIHGVVGLGRGAPSRKELEELRVELDVLRMQLHNLRRRVADMEGRPAPSAEPPPLPPTLVELPPEPPLPVLEEVEPPAAPSPPPVPRREEAPPLPWEERAEKGTFSFSAQQPSAPPGGEKVNVPFSAPEGAAEFEEVVGKRWLTWLGGLALFAAVGFFVKYSVERGWISPALRVVAGLVFGAGVLALGNWFVARKMRALGLGLIGAAGLPILYVSLYAGFHFYGLLPQPTAFGAMIVVTCLGMAIALYHDAITVSVLSVLGGLLTPLLVSTGQDARDQLFAYLLILDLGVLAVAFVKQWRALDLLAFVGTATFYAAWFARFYAPAAMVPALLWLGAFFLAFLIIPFAYHLGQRTPAFVERFVLAMVVAAAAFGCAWAILHEPAYRHALGHISLGMAACYLALGAAARRRIPADANSIFGLLALAMIFATIAVPLHFGLNGITLIWSVEAVALVYLGYRFAYAPVRIGGAIVLALAVLRLFARHWPLHDVQWLFARKESFALVLNPEFGVAAFVCLAAGAFAAVHHRWCKKASPGDAEAKLAAALGAGLLGLVMLHAEVAAWFRVGELLRGTPRFGDLPSSAGVVVWALGSLAFLAAGLRARSIAARWVAVGCLALAALIAAYLHTLAVPPGSWHFLTARFLSARAVVLAAFAQAFALRRWRAETSSGERHLPTTLALCGGAALLLIVHVDLAEWAGTWGTYEADCAVAALWAVASIDFLGAGLRARSLPTRIAGVAVLGVGFVLGLRLYQGMVMGDCAHFLNARFWVGVLLALAAFLHGYAPRRSREVCDENERSFCEAPLVAAGLTLLLVISFDLFWSLKATSGCLARSALAALWAAGSLGFLASGLRWPSLPRRVIAAALLVAALVPAAALFQRGLLEEFVIFLNLRFATCALVILAAFAFGRVLRRHAETCPGPEQGLATCLYVAAAAALFLILSADAYLYALKTVADPERARWASQMALSIVWSAYASVVLAFGFWKRVRPARLAALGLFGLTALKLVIVDIAHIEQVYRILSFFILGALMIAASYLYHRVEKRLEQQWARKP